MAELRSQAKAEKKRRELAKQLSDFPTFCGLCDIITKGGQRTKLRLNPIQRKYCAQRTARDVVLKPRQIGFTTLELARDIWTFLTQPGACVVIVVQSITGHGPLKQISKILRVMFEGLRSSGIELDFRTETLSEWELEGRDATLTVIEAGASEAAAVKKGRSGRITRLHLTETAFYEYAPATLNSLMECVPSIEFGSEVVNESTANGASGLFYEDYIGAAAGTSSFTAQFFSWLEQPEYRTELVAGERIVPETDRERQVVAKGATPEQLKWYRQKVADKKSQDLVDQEYPLDPDTCFITSGRLFFNVDRTKALIGLAREPIETRVIGKHGSQGALRIWKAPQGGRQYVLTGDPSEGVGGDPGAAVVLDRGTGEHVATIHGQFSTWEFARVLADLGHEYFGALIVVERNNHGHAVLQGLIREQKYPLRLIYHGNDGRPGWVNTGPARSSALDALHSAHEQKHWSSPDRMSLAEMLRFIVNEQGKAEAAKGAHDDLVLAHAIAWDVVCKPVTHRSAPAGLVA